MRTDLGNKDVFADNLKYYMRLKNVTQRTLADEIGVAYSTMNEWVKGKIYPRIDKIEMMANYFGIKKSDLIEDKDKFKPDGLSLILKEVSNNKEMYNLMLDIISLDEKDKATIIKFVSLFKEGDNK